MTGLCALLMVLTLVGCSTGATSYADYHFKSLEELAETVEKAGWSCVDPPDEDATNESVGKYEWAQGPCNRGSISAYASDAKRADIEGQSFNALEPGKARIDGGNRAVTGDRYKVEDALKILGGTLT